MLCSVNGNVTSSLPLTDRGLAYGHGLFETMRVEDGKILQLKFHLDRLKHGSMVLKMSLSMELVAAYLQEFIVKAAETGLRKGVIKLIVTAGSGGRGYRSPTLMTAEIICLWFPLPEDIELDGNKVVSLKLCEHRLVGNPVIAGLKHLNRLDQVLARAEWSDNQYQEGLMLDAEGRVIECIASNVFMVKNDVLLTPVLSQVGVLGVMRREIMETVCPGLDLPVFETDISLRQFTEADEIFITNSLYGVRAVVAIESLGEFPVGEKTSIIQKQVGRLLPCFQS